MFQFKITLVLSLLSLSLPQTAGADYPPLKTVDHLDIQKYLGKWYEIASIRHRFQKDCVASTATYTLLSNGDIDVLNQCRKHTLDGEPKSAHAKAWVPNSDEPGKLVVQFFWPFRGKYWVIELGENYDYAVVGHPTRDYLWILSRTPQMDQRLYDAILLRLKEKGYDLSRIETTHQPR